MKGRPRSEGRGRGAFSPPLRVVGLLLLLSAAALAQNPNILTVPRESATLVITNRGLSANGARTLLNRRGCEDGVVMSFFYGPPDQVEMVIDGENETRLRSSLVIIREPEGTDPDSADQQTVEMLDGEALFTDRPACLDSFVAAEQPSVLLEQGRTEVSASRFFLDSEVDIAELDGPIALERLAEADSEALSASAEAMSFNLETERSTLTGNVTVESGDRTSVADSLELDEEAGLATLVGTPASSQQGEDRIAGETLLYYLDSNDVVVIGGVTGTLEMDLE